MSDHATLRHPKLPADQTIRVARSRMGLRLAAGWVEVDPPVKQAPAVERDAETKPTESAQQRRGRKSTEEQ